MTTQKGGKKNRKMGRNKKLCQVYTMSGKHWTSKIKRIERELRLTGRKMERMITKQGRDASFISFHIATLESQLKSVRARMSATFTTKKATK